MTQSLTRGFLILALTALLALPFISNAAFYGSTTIGNVNVNTPEGEVLGASSGLTEQQIQAILGLLRAFGAESATINNVEAALRGNSSGGSDFGGLLSLSVAPSPGSQTVVPGTSQLLVTNIRADATGSSEDIRLPGLSLAYTDNVAIDPIDCRAFTQTNGLMAIHPINPNNNGPTTETYNFLFDSDLAVSKGTIEVIGIKCTIPASATSGSFRFGLVAGTSVVAKGAVSGESVSPSVTTNYGSTVTISTTASSLTINDSPASDTYRLVSAGSQNVETGVYRLQTLGEDVRLTKLGLKLTNGSASDLMKVTIWDGSTKVGEAFFTGTKVSALSTLVQPVLIPKSSYKDLTIKADLASIGTTQPVGESGHLIQIDYFDGEAVGNDSGNTIHPAGSTNVAGVRVMKSFPTVSLDTLPSTGLEDGRLMRFKVVADAHGDVGIGKLALTWSANNTSAPNAVDVYAYTDSSYTSPVPGGPHLGGTSQITGALHVLLNSPLIIPAGGVRYFEVRGNVIALGSGASFTTTLLGDGIYGGVETFAVMKEKGNLVWSPNSLTISLLAMDDWTNGFGVPGLPPSGISQTRTGATSGGGSTNETGDIGSGVFTSNTPTLGGNASGTGTVGISINRQGDKVYGSGIIPVSSGRWSHTITTSLANGSYEVVLYGSHNNKLASAFITIDTSFGSTPSKTEGPKVNIRSCSNPLKTGLVADALACYGLWDYGNEFGGDQNMCSSSAYGSPTTGCKVTTNACTSGTATASRYWIVKDATDYDIGVLADNFAVSSVAVKSQLIHVWEYTCDASPSNPVVTSTGYYEGKFYVKTTESSLGGKYRTLTKGETFIIGGKTYQTISNSNVGNIYLPSSADGVIKVGDIVFRPPNFEAP